jgi:hypothetical protein
VMDRTQRVVARENMTDVDLSQRFAVRNAIRHNQREHHHKLII